MRILGNLARLLSCLFMFTVLNLQAECGVFTSVESVYLFSLGLQNDGSVWAWGANNHGQIGNGTTVTALSPVQVPTVPFASKVDAGYFHALAVGSDGTVWVWGSNQYGQLGIGTTVDSLTAVQVPGLTGVIDVAGGGYHSLALTSDGTVWAWGSNYYGQLGRGDGSSKGNSLNPVQIPGLTNVVAIDCGGYFSLALKNDGTVWAWGNNLYGQIGDGTNTDAFAPKKVKDVNLNDIIASAVAAGSLHSLALQVDGTVLAWGNNQQGQLGNNSTTNSNRPQEVSNIDQVSAIAGGGFHSLALTSNSQVWTWGSNSDGQLGNGTTAPTSLIPVLVSDAQMQNVTAIAGGYDHCLAVSSDGLAWGWGLNIHGELGNNTMINAKVPVKVNYQPPAIFASPSSQAVCSGSVTNIALSSNVDADLSWTVLTDNVVGASDGSGNTIGQQLTLINPFLAGSAVYTVTANTGGCEITPLTIPVTVNPIPMAAAIPPTQTITSNQVTNIALMSNVPGTSFCWTVSATDVTGASPGCGTQINQRLKLVSNKKTGSVTYTITPTANGCIGAPITVTVTVKK